MSASLPALVRALPVPEIRSLAVLQFRRGAPFDRIVDELVEVLDRLVDWRDVIPGPAGALVEASDGAMLRAVVRLIVGGVARKRNRETGRLPVTLENA